MPGPLLPIAIAGAVAGLAAYLSRRREAREAPVLAELAIRIPRARLEGEELTVMHRGLDVVVGFGVPQSHPHFERGLYARADYAIGAGPTFTASARDVSAHARRPGTGYPLGARFSRGYDVVGDHRDARALVLPVLSRVHTGFLPAPLFHGNGSEILVHLPELIPGDDKLEVAEQLIALTGELALFGYDVLERLRGDVGGAIAVEPTRTPSIYLRATRDEATVEILPRWQVAAGGASELGLVLVAQRGPRALGLDEAIATLATLEERRRAAQLIESAPSAPTQVRVVLARVPALADLELALKVLVRLAGQVGRDSPFR